MAHAGEGFGPLDLSHVLGLNPITMAPLKPRKWLWMAAQTCSVSYRKTLTPETLLSILTTGDVPDENVSNIVHFLQEAPVQNVVMAVDQAAQQSGLSTSSEPSRPSCQPSPLSAESAATISGDA